MSNWHGMHCPVDRAEFAKSAFAISGLDIRFQPGRSVEIGHEKHRFELLIRVCLVIVMMNMELRFGIRSPRSCLVEHPTHKMMWKLHQFNCDHDFQLQITQIECDMNDIAGEHVSTLRKPCIVRE